MVSGLSLLMLHREMLIRLSTRGAATTVQALYEALHRDDPESAELRRSMERLMAVNPECIGLAVLQDGVVTVSVGNVGWLRRTDIQELVTEGSFEAVEHDGEQLLVRQGPDAGTVIGGQFAYRQVDRALLRDGLVVAGSMLLGLALAMLLARTLGAGRSQDLLRLRQAVRRVAQGHLSQRVDVPEEGDLADLAVAINTMARQLEITLGDLQGAYSELARLDEIKADMLATVSHELRTPLTALRGYLGLLAAGRMGPLDEPVASAVGTCQANVERLSRRVEGMVQIIDMEHRGPESVEPVELHTLLAGALEVFVPRIEEKEIASRLSVDDGRLTVWGRRDELERVLLNLLDNAVKFTPAHGSVTVEARQQEREGRQGALVVITDSGPGIAPAEQLRVFDRFYQVDPSARRRHGGMGLGLALVRSTVERHGGAVWLESLPGVGSAFFVWLPADTEGGTEQACAPATPA
jgi:signal transduction histidine kinase